VTDKARRHFFLPDVISIPFDGIDCEHESVVALLNDAFNALQDTNADPAVFPQRCAEFRAEMDEHFRHEERLMESTGYPNLAQHRLHHRNIRDRIDLLRNVDGADWDGALAMLESLYDALISEVLRADLDFKTHLEGKGLIDRTRA
jgi:hemerythrin-like metal-binding protein